MSAEQRAEHLPESMQSTIDWLAERGARFLLRIEHVEIDVQAWDRLREQLRSDITAVICKAEVK